MDRQLLSKPSCFPPYQPSLALLIPDHNICLQMHYRLIGGYQEDLLHSTNLAARRLSNLNFCFWSLFLIHSAMPVVSVVCRGGLEVEEYG